MNLPTGIRSWYRGRKDSLMQTHHNHPWIWPVVKWIVAIVVFGGICTIYYSERNARTAEEANDIEIVNTKIAKAALKVAIQGKNLEAEQLFKNGVC